MPSVDELVGSVKIPTDLSSEQVRIRYNESSSVIGQNGRKITLNFPKLVNRFLDLSSVRLDFTFDSTGDSQMDAYSYSSLFQRVVVKSSSTVLMDIQDYGTLATTLAHTDTTVNTNYNDRLTQGLFLSQAEAKTAAVANRVSLKFVAGTILNCPALLPLDKLNGFLSLELYLADPRKILFSATNDLLATYSMTDIQLICEYIASPSLTQYYNTQSINFSVSNWTHRYQQVQDLKSILRLPSAYNSLCRVLIGVRLQNLVDSLSDLNIPDRQQRFLHYSYISELQCYVNNRPFFSEPISDVRLLTELWHEAKDSFPGLGSTAYYTDVSNMVQVNGCPFIGINLCSAPSKFSKGIVSGLKTTNMVSDMYITLNWASNLIQLGHTLCATCFLDNDARIYQDSSGNLQIEN